VGRKRAAQWRIKMKLSKIYSKDLQVELERSSTYDPSWTASMPYPENPFTRVQPSELAKWGKAQKPDPMTSFGKALL
jgi:hypothetical protein